MKRSFKSLLLSSLLLLSAAAPAQSADEVRALKTQVEELRAQMGQIDRRLQREEDNTAIRRLAFSYGYYMDNALYKQVLSLFSPNIVSCEVGGYGVFNGLAGCRKIWMDAMGHYYGGAEGKLTFGKLVKHHLLKDIITIAPDGKTAHGRFDYIGWGATFGVPKSQGHQLGVYNLDFVKEDGIWKIGKFRLTFDTSHFDAFDFPTNPKTHCPRSSVKADAPPTIDHPFPEVWTHIEEANPVTGEKIPDYVSERHYWVGSWPGEWDKPCGIVGQPPKTAPAH